MTRVYSNTFQVNVTSQAGQPGQPTWMTTAINAGNLPLRKWYQIPGTTMASVMTYPKPSSRQYSSIMQYSGGAMKHSGSEQFIFGGGHDDYDGNEVLSLRLANNAPAWVVRIRPTMTTQSNVARYPDGRPSSRHSGRSIAYIQSMDRLVCFGGWALYGTAIDTRVVEMFNPGGGGPLGLGEWDHINGIDYANLVAMDNSTNVPLPQAFDADGNWWCHLNQGSRLMKWTFATKTSALVGASQNGLSYTDGACLDPVRNKIVIFQPDSGGYPFFGSRWIDPTNAVVTAVTMSGLGWSTNRLDPIWCPETNSFIVNNYSNGNIYEATYVSGTTYNVQLLSGMSGTGPGTSALDDFGGHFFYAPELKLFGRVKTINDNVWVFRIA